MNAVILDILGVATVASLLVIMLGALAQLRDELVNTGFISEDSRLGRQSVKLQNARLARVLSQVGVPAEYISALKMVSQAPAIPPTSRSDQPLSIRLLLQLKRSTRHLPVDFYYEGTGQFYVDVMGDMYFPDRDDRRPSYARLLHEWLSLAMKAGHIQPPDCILANKEGCVILAQRLRSLISPTGEVGLLVARMKHDRARVKREDAETPHRTDIEGLEAFLRVNSDAGKSGRRFNVLFVDDSCTGASNLKSAVTTFNTLVRVQNLPFNPVTTAVVLFAVKSADAERSCREANVSLHAVVAFGSEEVKTLWTEKEKHISSHAAWFKDYFACKVSRDLKA